MVLQNRLDFKDSQRLSQRPGAYFLFRVFAFKHPVSMYCSELYILCTICTVYCQYVLWTIYCVPYVQCTVSMYCSELYIVHHTSVLSVCTVNYILCASTECRLDIFTLIYHLGMMINVQSRNSWKSSSF